LGITPILGVAAICSEDSIPPSIPGDFVAPVANPGDHPAVRRKTNLKTNAILLNPLDSSEFEVVCVELGTDSMAFHSFIEFFSDEKMAVRLPSGGLERLILCKTRRCDRADDGKYLVEVVFIEIASKAEGDGVPFRWYARASNLSP
jgi:hypothetical protein